MALLLCGVWDAGAELSLALSSWCSRGWEPVWNWAILLPIGCPRGGGFTAQ
jgi:hypothetical protein